MTTVNMIMVIPQLKLLQMTLGYVKLIAEDTRDIPLLVNLTHNCNTSSHLVPEISC